MRVLSTTVRVDSLGEKKWWADAALLSCLQAHIDVSSKLQIATDRFFCRYDDGLIAYRSQSRRCRILKASCLFVRVLGFNCI